MIEAKRVLRAESAAKPDLAAITQALKDYEGTVKARRTGFRRRRRAQDRLDVFMSTAKSYLVTAKQLMRRIRDHVPYSQPATR